MPVFSTNYFSKGISIEFVSQRVRTIFLYSGVPGLRVENESNEYARFDGATSEGVTLDSAYEQVVKAYGPPEDKGDLALGSQIPITTLIYRSLGVEFTFVKGSGQMTHMCIYARGY
jgi:hypothetical protein